MLVLTSNDFFGPVSRGGGIFSFIIGSDRAVLYWVLVNLSGIASAVFITLYVIVKFIAKKRFGGMSITI